MNDVPPSSDPQQNPPPEDKVRQISKRKVLYIDLDAEITSIFEKIANLPYRDVYLVVPERAMLLQSVVNLQILRKKVEDLGKSLSLITQDKVGAKLAHQAGIPIFDQIQGSTPTKSQEGTSPIPGEPMKAMGNEVHDEQPHRLSQKKVSIFEVVKGNKAKSSSPLTFVRRFLERKEENKSLNMPSPFILGAPSKKTLGTLVAASLCILLVISYIALPGATVTITPKSNVLEQSVNITLANANVYGTSPSIAEGHVIVAYPISITFEQTLSYTATGTVFQGTNASGTVTVINERETPWDLVAFTRLQTEDGLVFRTQSAVRVPAATSAGFGTVDVQVVADETDAYNRVIGERGNIEASSFVLPGLREESQKQLYARSNAPMTGGSSLVTLKVSQADIDAAQLLLTAQLENSAEAKLDEEITRRNTLNATNLTSLKGYGALTLSDPSISVPANLVDALQDQFEVKGSITVSGYAFSYDEFLTEMKTALEAKKSPDKNLIKLDENSVTYEVFEVNQTNGLIRFTATMKGIEAYNLDPETETGAALVKKIKEHIAGKPIKEAENYIQNLSEVNKVDISCWPLWAPTIPSVLENIEIKIDNS
ncbi:MAG: hypothetical protein WC882_00825 [Candidatus Gracilibacteria bacterium]